MKRLLLLLALSAAAAHAQLIVNDFSGFTPDVYSQPFPANNTSWSPATAQSGATAFTIGDFGQGAPGGAIGNGFISFLPGATDWSAYTTITLRGFASRTNATPSLSFYLEDDATSSALSVFALADFGVGPAPTDVTISLSFLGLDSSRITAWGFVVQEFDNPAFGFTFDQVALGLPTQPNAVPEPSTYSVMAALVLVGIATVRRLRPSAK